LPHPSVEIFDVLTIFAGEDVVVDDIN